MVLLSAVSTSRVAYRAKQLALFAQFAALRKAAGLSPQRHEPALVSQMEKSFNRLLDVDYGDAKAGVYPVDLLFDGSTAEHMRTIPRFALDFPRTRKRREQNQFLDIPTEIERDRYPGYFLRNFHWQTDGYFSKHSAELYETGVEFVFLGAGDAMRRRILKPIASFAAKNEVNRILEVGCGTGRTLRHLAAILPSAKLYGVDLSEAYLERARERVAHLPRISLSQENGEALPYRDGHFDVVTSVFMFHELPRAARRRVLAEMARVVRPGGLVVVADSTQKSDSPSLTSVLEQFPKDFHEPYYLDYIDDDLGTQPVAVGLRTLDSQTHFVTRVVVAQRPI